MSKIGQINYALAVPISPYSFCRVHRGSPILLAIGNYFFVVVVRGIARLLTMPYLGKLQRNENSS